jgi:hypothetical protein
MRRARHLMPYIRRRHSGDCADSLRTALRMEVFGPRCYVLVQRGKPRRVLEAAQTRRDLASGLGLRPSARHVRQWARRFRKFCQPHRSNG